MRAFCIIHIAVKDGYSIYWPACSGVPICLMYFNHFLSIATYYKNFTFFSSCYLMPHSIKHLTISRFYIHLLFIIATCIFANEGQRNKYKTKVLKQFIVIFMSDSIWVIYTLYKSYEKKNIYIL